MDHLNLSLLNTFTAQPLNRSSLERKDAIWLTDQLNNPSAEYLVLDETSVVVINRVPLILSHKQFHSLKSKCHSSFNPSLLGLKKSDNTPVFIVNISEPTETLSIFKKQLFDDFYLSSEVSSLIGEDKFIESLSLREITNHIDPELASMYSYATMLNHWHINTRFCTHCGSGLDIKEGGSIQQCSNEACGHIEYPRINPAVIMRVTKGNKILLARQENWRESMYSVLAGFVEVGETLEHAVEREVMEEVNITVENINYHSSQPWPFPNSFMLGYTADAISGQLDFEQDDIEHALWLTAEELKEKMAEGTISPPGILSISYRLIDDWFQAETGVSLAEFTSSLTQNES